VSIENHVYVFGSFRFLARQQLLVRDGEPVKLGGRALDILHVLVTSAGELVTKRALQQAVWPSTFVHESNLKVHIHSLRRALGETSPQPTYIATVAGRGYRFMPLVSIESTVPAEVRREGVPLLPSLPTQQILIGREYEIDRVANLIAEWRVVTLVGPGGVGKTSVALSVAHRVSQRFPDGIVFVDLSITTDSSAVPLLLAAACGIRGRPADIVAAVADHLKDRRILVVIDSCEHVLASVALIATRFREARVAARLLATSIEPLRLSTEIVQLIEPLTYPSSGNVETLSDGLGYSSFELFTVRALEWADYTVTESDVASVATLCERLGGLPLAIELAAAKLDEYSPATLLKSLDPNLSVLRNEDPGVHPRHRTMWAMLDWSYQLLSASEADIFRLIALFSGAFAQEDVAAMAQKAAYSPYQTTVALGELVAKSLVTAEVAGDSLCYRLLDCVRAYAVERLDEQTSVYDVHKHFACFMNSVLERFEAERANHSLTAQRLAHYKQKLDDVRAVLNWCFGAGNDPELGTKLTVAAIPLWHELALMAEEGIQVERALKLAPLAFGASQRADLALSRAWSMTSHRLTDTWNAWDEALELADQTQDVERRLRALYGYSTSLILGGRYHDALAGLSQFRQLAEMERKSAALPDHDRVRAMAGLYLGELAEVRETFEELSRALTNGLNGSGIARYQVESYVVIETCLAVATWLMGAPDQAAAIAAEAVDRLGRASHPVAQSWALGAGAIPVALWNGDLETLERYTAHLGGNLIDSCAYWGPLHRFFRAAVFHLRGEQVAVADMRSAIDQMLATGFFLDVQMFLGILSEALVTTGAIADADNTIEEALTLQRQTHEKYTFPELLRIKAKVLQARGSQELAEQKLREALASAEEMGARSLQLRVACDLAELWIAGGRQRPARALLRPIYKAFSEGLNTRDLRRATSLLGTATELTSTSTTPESDDDGRLRGCVT
jgi:predicted ATPase/DNA-binding winged helix-turn-helix (wHTH) protein